MEPLDRLKENIFDFPYACDGKDANDIFMPVRRIVKETALTKKIIQLNGPRKRTYMVFDIDRPLGAFAWEDANLPAPTLTISNPKNGHAHLVYELAQPVWFPKKDDPRPDTHSVRYWKAVYKAFQSALRADPGYTGLVAKNPLHPHWRVSYGGIKPYSLCDLAAHVDLTTLPKKAEIREVHGRRATLFESIRLWAYRAKQNFSNLSDFHAAIVDQLEQINDSFEKGPETVATIRSIAKSVSHYVWFRYTPRNSGIMGLNPADPLVVRQQLGQRYTCSVRINKTLSRIRLAVEAILTKGIMLTKTAVAKMANLHRNTVHVYWKDILSLLSCSLKEETEAPTEPSISAPTGLPACLTDTRPNRAPRNHQEPRPTTLPNRISRKLKSLIFEHLDKNEQRNL
jgi:hypothetical protein